MKAHFKLSMNCDTAAQYLYTAIAAEVEYRGMEFVTNDELTSQVDRVAKWLCGSTHKNSLFLAGQCGNGKTTFVRAIQNLVNHLNILNPTTGKPFGITFLNAKVIADYCKKNPEQWRAICDREILAIDDLGTEPREVLDFGNVLSPIIDLISYRYENQLPTIITSNLKPEQIREVYGTRIADRLKETTEIVPFNNGSYRG